MQFVSSIGVTFFFCVYFTFLLCLFNCVYLISDKSTKNNKLFHTNLAIWYHGYWLTNFNKYSSLWSLVCGLWYVVSGLWSMVSGLWPLLYGLWSRGIEYSIIELNFFEYSKIQCWIIESLNHWIFKNIEWLNIRITEYSKTLNIRNIE